MPKISRIIFPCFLILCLILCNIHSSSSEAENASQDCPKKDFKCGVLGNLRFPFFPSSSHPDCGLIALDCNSVPHPKLELSGKKYDVVGTDDSVLHIIDRELETLLAKRSCRVFGRNPSFPSSPVISYEIPPISTLTLFSCNTSKLNSRQKQSIRNDFWGFQSYNKCGGGLVVFYKQHPNDDDHRDNITSCSRIQLPFSVNKLNNDSPFGLINAAFSLEFRLPDDCLDCHERGGRCDVDPDNSNEYSCEQKKVDFILLLRVAACGGALAGVVVLVLFFRWENMCGYIWNFIRPKTENEKKLENFLTTNGTQAPKRYSFSQVKEMTNSFDTLVGEGGYGSVYKGKLSDGSIAAVKVLKGGGGGEEFINEVVSISRTSHVNIVTLKGFCFEGSKRALVYEFMSNGSLEKFIYENKNSWGGRKLEWKVLYRIAIGIARGLEYLHRGCNTQILHFDIKPHNILLDEGFTPKISDFGFAKTCSRGEGSSNVMVYSARGTVGYIAPEVVCRGVGGVSYKSDVYSFGIMVLEMVSGRCVSGGASETYFPHWIYSRLELGSMIELNGIANEEDEKCARKMIMVSLWCIQIDPTKRPTMSKVVEMLQGDLSNLEIPPKPYFSSPSSRSEIGCSSTLFSKRETVDSV